MNNITPATQTIDNRSYFKNFFSCYKRNQRTGLINSQTAFVDPEATHPHIVPETTASTPEIIDWKGKERLKNLKQALHAVSKKVDKRENLVIALQKKNSWGNNKYSYSELIDAVRSTETNLNVIDLDVTHDLKYLPKDKRYEEIKANFQKLRNKVETQKKIIKAAIKSRSEFNKEQMITLFQELDKECGARGIKAEICIYGGALMMLLGLNNKVITHDVDATYCPEELIEIGHLIADKYGVAKWLDDEIATLLPEENKKEISNAPIPGLEGLNHLQITHPTLQYALAIKCSKFREKEISDIEFLLNYLGLTTKEQVFAITRFYPDRPIRKDTAAFVADFMEKKFPAGKNAQ